MKKTFIIQKSKSLNGELTVPGDKSISHRSIIFSSLAKGVSQINGLLKGQDVICTMTAMKALGVRIEEDNQTILVHGTNNYKTPKEPIYLGNSGTSIRLLSGLFCGLNISTKLCGDESLSKRPMKRVTQPLSDLGFNIQTNESGLPPITIQSSASSKNEDYSYTMPIASAQVKSCLLLARLNNSAKTTITEPAPCRNHTELMMQSYGIDTKIDKNTFSFSGGKELIAQDITVPSDISSAAFFMVAASIIEGSNLTLRNVGINRTRDGIITLLRQMGANIEINNAREAGKEPVADITVKSAQLHGIKVDKKLVPLAIDEFPVFFIAATCAKGKTTLNNAEELRYKESDRIKTMTNALKLMGVQVTEFPDGIEIIGGKITAPTKPIHCEHDHRIAMSLAIAGTVLNENFITITGCETVDTSFPNFINLANQVGINIQSI